MLSLRALIILSLVIAVLGKSDVEPDTDTGTAENIEESLFPSPDPKADPAAIVESGKARFTVLTSHIIRMEWSDQSVFEDRASIAFINRKLSVPRFETSRQGDWLIIKTDNVTVRYLTVSEDGESNESFDASNLKVTVTFLDGAKKREVEWTSETPPTGNMWGAIRTLDQMEGAVPFDCSYLPPHQHCTPGIISRDGWALVDDSQRALLDGNQEWEWTLPRPNNKSLDWYFFGHGHDFHRALKEFVLVSGPVPIPPRYAFGTWWSRWFAFSDLEFQDLVEEYEKFLLPLDVLVVDMDWHLTFYKRSNMGEKDQADEMLGWTGYTWDKTLFPDPKAFLDWCHRRGLKITMNLHPAAGIQPHEENYPNMAKGMGIDPRTKKYVAFDIGNKTFATNYWKHILRPLEEQGVDFWWLDWQAGEAPVVWGLGPTLWLNHVFYTNPYHWKDNLRPLNFHRFGGLGSHRYPVGFSGDVWASWQSLEFQPFFTQAAANLGFAYWSHDLGGHYDGPEGPDPEVLTRWLQLGLFSPVFRSHCSKDPVNERRIWTFGYKYLPAMRQAFQMRLGLIPYIYTQARLTYETGVAFVRGLYIDYPDSPEAYVPDFQWQFQYVRHPQSGRLMRALLPAIPENEDGAFENAVSEGAGVAPNPQESEIDRTRRIEKGLMGGRKKEPTHAHRTQFLFGSDMMIGVVTKPLSNQTGLANMTYWIPPGHWIEWFTGTAVEGPAFVKRFFTLEEMPVYVKAGAIIPMLPQEKRVGLGRAQEIPDALVLLVFTGTQTGTTRIYDDDGKSTHYKTGVHAWTKVTYTQKTPKKLRLMIGRMKGDFEGKPATRSYEVRFLLSWPPETVKLNGTKIPFTAQGADTPSQSHPSWWYDGKELAIIVNTGSLPTGEKTNIDVELSKAMDKAVLQSGIVGSTKRMKTVKSIIDNNYHKRLYHEDTQSVIQASQLPSRLTSSPQSAFDDLPKYAKLLSRAKDEMRQFSYVPQIRDRVLALMGVTA